MTANDPPDRSIATDSSIGTIYYTPYQSELELPLITALIEKELSEPYIVYTYRYFLNQWPELCWLAWQTAPSSTSDSLPGTRAKQGDQPIGVIVCKLDRHLKGERKLRGYIAMLSVLPSCRGKGIASNLVQAAISSMLPLGVQEVVLETEYDNVASLALYARLGFMKEKRLHHFYLNGKDCFRLRLEVGDEVKRGLKEWKQGQQPSQANRAGQGYNNDTQMDDKDG